MKYDKKYLNPNYKNSKREICKAIEKKQDELLRKAKRGKK